MGGDKCLHEVTNVCMKLIEPKMCRGNNQYQKHECFFAQKVDMEGIDFLRGI